MTGVLALTILSAILETKLMRPGYPIVSLALLLPLTLITPYRILIPLAFFVGVVKDALYLNTLWLSPLLFTILAFSGLIYRSYVNVKLFVPKAIYFILFVVIYTWILGTVHLTEPNLFELFRTAIFTGVIAFFVERWVS